MRSRNKKSDAFVTSCLFSISRGERNLTGTVARSPSGLKYSNYLVLHEKPARCLAVKQAFSRVLSSEPDRLVPRPRRRRKHELSHTDTSRAEARNIEREIIFVFAVVPHSVFLDDFTPMTE